jgi:hypothetical protein
MISHTKRREANFNPNTLFQLLLNSQCEAVEALNEWLKPGECRLVGMQLRGDPMSKLARVCKGIQPGDDEIFYAPMHNAEFVWNYVLKEAGLGQKDASANWRVLHIHTLRKFFNTK